MTGQWGGVSTHSPGDQHSPGQEQEFTLLEKHPGFGLGSELRGQRLLNNLCLWLRAWGQLRGTRPIGSEVVGLSRTNPPTIQVIVWMPHNDI